MKRQEQTKPFIMLFKLNRTFGLLVHMQILNISNFEPLEAVYRFSEPQLPVGENINRIQWRFSG